MSNVILMFYFSSVYSVSLMLSFFHSLDKCLIVIYVGKLTFYFELVESVELVRTVILLSARHDVALIGLTLNQRVTG
jgi:hypothetical protein